MPDDDVPWSVRDQQIQDKEEARRRSERREDPPGIKIPIYDSRTGWFGGFFHKLFGKKQQEPIPQENTNEE